MKKALIVGSQGQDGRLLSIFLKQKEYIVHGIGRSAPNSSNLDEYIQLDLNCPDQVIDCFKETYDEIYYIAAHHHASNDLELNDQSSLISKSYNINVFSFVKILEYIKKSKIDSKVFYCSSSLIYEGVDERTQSEKTPPQPESIYAVTKYSAMRIAKYYRETYGVFVSIGILYNHESLYRNDNFLSKIIVNGVRDIVNGKLKQLQIGQLNAKTDWGYANDYVSAMWHILQQDDSDEFIISSGELKEVKDWLIVLSNQLNIDWTKFVVENPNLLKRKKKVLLGDNSKLKKSGWTPETSFDEMVAKIYNNQI